MDIRFTSFPVLYDSWSLRRSYFNFFPKTVARTCGYASGPGIKVKCNFQSSFFVKKITFRINY